MKNFYLIALIFFVSHAANAQTVMIGASQDNSIYQNLPGNSNGAGVNIFAGTNGATSPRRALLKFNIAAAIPANSTITSVTLTLYCNRTISGNTNVTLHRLFQNWGEGTSDAGGTNDGDGAPAALNDATWNCSFSNGAGGCSTPWTTAGGSYNGTASATASVGGIGASYNWSSATMNSDVQSWLDAPGTNYGWILRGDEANGGTAKRFSSSENSSNRPVLSVTYMPTVPVKLVFFSGLETNYGNALSWETAQEINNAFFSIEHSMDGSYFSSLGKVIGAGTTSLAQKYNFMHSAPSAGQHYYRLAQFDLDGKINYSHIVAINQKSVSKNILISPNPVKDKIVFQGFAQGKRSYVIIDLAGKKLVHGVLANELLLPAMLSPGTYYIRILQDDGQLFTGKFVKE